MLVSENPQRTKYAELWISIIKQLKTVGRHASHAHVFGRARQGVLQEAQRVQESEDILQRPKS